MVLLPQTPLCRTLHLLPQLLVGEMHVVAPLMALDRAARTDRIGLEVERNLQGACTKAWGHAYIRRVESW